MESGKVIARIPGFRVAASRLRIYGSVFRFVLVFDCWSTPAIVDQTIESKRVQAFIQGKAALQDEIWNLQSETVI